MLHFCRKFSSGVTAYEPKFLADDVDVDIFPYFWQLSAQSQQTVHTAQAARDMSTSWLLHNLCNWSYFEGISKGRRNLSNSIKCL